MIEEREDLSNTKYDPFGDPGIEKTIIQELSNRISESESWTSEGNMKKKSVFEWKTSWWFQPIWKILVKLDHFPR